MRPVQQVIQINKMHLLSLECFVCHDTTHSQANYIVQTVILINYSQILP